MLDFDSINDWDLEFRNLLRRHIPSSVLARIAAASPEYVEDALDQLFVLTERDSVIDAVTCFIGSGQVVGYHGSRLTDSDVISIRRFGLVPLKGENRRTRLIRALSPHPKWKQAANRLDAVIEDHGRNGAAGHRENQVHLTLSKAGLTDCFDHYLTHGAEFDQHVARELLGSEGMDLLALDGEARIVRIIVPGERALDAANPYFSINDRRARGEVPNLVREFLEAWSYRLAHPGSQSRTRRLDCGMVFRQTVPPEWIADVLRIENGTCSL